MVTKHKGVHFEEEDGRSFAVWTDVCRCDLERIVGVSYVVRRFLDKHCFIVTPDPRYDREEIKEAICTLQEVFIES